MAIYGNTISFGGGGQNDTLPPLLDNFRANKGKHETVALKNIPLGSTFIIGKYKSKPIKWVYFGKGTHSSSTDGNLKVFDKYLLSPKEFDGKNGVSTFIPPPDTGNVEYGKQYCCLGQWLNSDKKGGSWYVVPNTPQQGIFLQYNPSDYVSENGFLYEWSEEEKNLLKDVMTAGDLNSKVTLPRQEDLTTEYFEGATLVLESLTEDFDPYADYNIFWRMQSAYSENEVYIYGYKDKEKHGQKDDSQKGLPSPERENVTAKLHFEPVIHIDENTQFVFNGTDYVLESAMETQPIVISADKMQESRATDLAGTVWVYGDHLPKNVNDGTKINLTREEIVLPEEGDTDIPPISYTELERPTSTKTWTAPEDGYYKFVGVAAGGYSGVARRTVGASYNVSGGSGGSGGIVASVFKLKRGESVSLTVAGGNVTISYGSETAKATCGGHGSSSSSEPDNKVKTGLFGEAGTATGGNIVNMNGKYGSPGKRLEGNKSTIVRGGETVYEKYISRGGYAKSTTKEGDTSPLDKGTTAYIAVLKGNSPSNKPLNFTTKVTKTIGMLPSKSKVKLGRYGGKELVWFTCKDKNQKQYLIFSDNQAVQSPFVSMMFDNKEPSNPSIEQKQSGNSRYLYSNIHQWLNSDKPANQWYSPQHTYDAPPDYQNKDGFLKDWTSEEKAVLVNNQWTCRRIASEGGGNDIFNARVVLPSSTEVENDMPNNKLDIFTDNNSRKLPEDRDWFLRDPQDDNTVYVKIVYQYGVLYQSLCTDKKVIRPLVVINPDVIVSETTDQDGCYTLQLKPPIPTTVEKQVQWDNTKDFYARQFTYNPKKQYQTMLEGATAFISRPTMKVGDLPSKSVVKLGKYSSTILPPSQIAEFQTLTWLTTKDAEKNQYLIFSPESTKTAPFNSMMYDNKEPNNPDADRQEYGNNNYPLSNIHQWLNAEGKENGLNDWQASHEYDTEPPYALDNGFLKFWTEQEKSVLLNKEWTTTKTNVDGGGTETFTSKVTLPSTTEMGLETGTGGSKLDIFNSNEDRKLGKFYFCRTPYLLRADDVHGVGFAGILDRANAYGGYSVRPLVNISPDTLVYAEPDENGVYSFCFGKEDQIMGTARKVYEYRSVAPEDKNLIWIQPDGLAKFWNGSEWVAIAGVYAEEEG